MLISKEKVVTIDYTLHDDQGNLIDSTRGGVPLSYVHGVNAIVPGLEQALEGRSPGDSVHVQVSPEEGYGARDEALVFDLPKEQFVSSGVQNPQEGMQFQVQSEDSVYLITIVGVESDQIKVDANHPLAGKMLDFDVKVVDVRAASDEELEHGHVHDSSGDHHHE